MPFLTPTDTLRVGAWDPASTPVPEALVAGLTAALAAKASTAALADKADLVGGKVPSSQLPSVALVEYLGTVASQAAMLALTGQPGDWCLRTDTATTTLWILIAADPTLIGSWQQATYAGGAVDSVNGQTGTVVLSKSDIGLANVDNTSDASKPVSTAQAAAIAAAAAARALNYTYSANVLFVRSGGNNGTAAPGNPNLAYQTLQAAFDYARTQAGAFLFDIDTGTFNITVNSDMGYEYTFVGKGVGVTTVNVYSKGVDGSGSNGTNGYQVILRPCDITVNIDARGGDAAAAAEFQSVNAGAGGYVRLMGNGNARVETLLNGGGQCSNGAYEGAICYSAPNGGLYLSGMSVGTVVSYPSTGTDNMMADGASGTFDNCDFRSGGVAGPAAPAYFYVGRSSYAIGSFSWATDVGGNAGF